MTKSSNKKVSFLYALLGMFIIFGHVFFYKGDTAKILDYKMYDVLTEYVGQNNNTENSSNVVVLDIDEKSLASLGQWPWPRIVLAKVLQKVNSYHPSAIGMDILFSEKDRTSPKEINAFYKQNFHIDNAVTGIPKQFIDNDLIFSSSLRRTGTVMGVYLHNDGDNKCNALKTLQLNMQYFELDSFKHIICNTPALNSNAKYHGFVNTYIDEDAVLRRMPLLRMYNDIIVPTLSLATLLSIDDSLKSIDEGGLEILTHKILTDKKSNILLKFYNENWYRKVSIADVLSGRIPKEILMGKIVLLGSSAVSLHDQVIISGGKKMIGVKVHMTMIDNILNEEYLIQPDYYKTINILISFFLSLLLLFLLYKKHKKSIVILFLLSILSISIASVLSFQNAIYISLTYFLVPFLFYFFLLSIIYILIDTYDKYLFKEELTKQHIEQLDAKVKERTAQLVESHKHIEENINYASLIQNALLPSQEIISKYCSDSFIIWKPRNTVGGDIYFTTELSSKKEILIMVIDGAGHGVSGAFITMLVKAIEVQIVADIQSGNIQADPALILSYFNKSMKTMLKQEKDSKSNAGFDGGVLYYNKETNICTYAGAKTPLYIINDEDISIIKSDRKNVGYIRTRMDQTYTNHDISIKKGTSLYISTDGIYDQESLEQTRFGKKKFQELLQNIQKKPFQQQKNDILNELEKFQTTCTQSDDITIFGIKF